MSLEKLAAAAASILQSFYTGIENLLLYLSKALDGSVPNTPSWHRDLLDIASSPTPYRPSIIGASTRSNSGSPSFRTRHLGNNPYRHRTVSRFPAERSSKIRP